MYYYNVGVYNYRCLHTITNDKNYFNGISFSNKLKCDWHVDKQESKPKTQNRKQHHQTMCIDFYIKTQKKLQSRKHHVF